MKLSIMLYSCCKEQKLCVKGDDSLLKIMSKIRGRTGSNKFEYTEISRKIRYKFHSKGLI